MAARAAMGSGLVFRWPRDGRRLMWKKRLTGGIPDSGRPAASRG